MQHNGGLGTDMSIVTVLYRPLTAYRDGRVWGKVGLWEVPMRAGRSRTELTSAIPEHTGIVDRTQDSQVRPLTSRQTAVLRLLARGYPNKAIAAELDISISAVGSHIAKLAARYRASGRAGVVGAAASAGDLSQRGVD